MTRFLLFFATNIAIMVVISVVFRVFGLEATMGPNGPNMQSLLIFSAVIGFSGSIISLFLSKTMAKRSMGVRVLESPTDATEAWLVNTVQQQAKAADIGMPEVGIYEGPELNAFATGWNKNSALVAVSRGLLDGMSRQEVEAVLAHEVSHVANGDMVTLTLIQGVVNTFVVFLSRLAGYWVDRVVFRNDSGRGIGYFLSSMVFQVLFGMLASVIVMWFSRYREFRADEGGAKLAGRENMIAALQRLRGGANAGHQHQVMPKEMAAMGISGNIGQGMKRLFMTHPPLEERIEALRQR